jgi:hypothetical protein
MGDNTASTTTTSDTTITGPSLFFTKLPPEIRDMIYRKLVDDEPARPTRSLLFRPIFPSGLKGVNYGKSPKLVSRQFREEFLELVGEDPRAYAVLEFSEHFQQSRSRFGARRRDFSILRNPCETFYPRDTVTISDQRHRIPDTILYQIQTVTIICDISRTNLAMSPPPNSLKKCGIDYAPSIMTALSIPPFLHRVRNIIFEIELGVDPVSGDNYSIQWLNFQMRPLALLLPQGTLIKISIGLYDSEATLHHSRLWEDNDFYALTAGLNELWWQHYNHNGEEPDLKGEHRCWRCLVEHESEHRYKRFDDAWWAANPPRSNPRHSSTLP